MDKPQGKEWYNWPWKLSVHARERLEQRGLDMPLLRQVWGNAQDVRLTKRGTFAISGRHDGRAIEIIVSPLPTRELLIVTAYERGTS